MKMNLEDIIKKEDEQRVKKHIMQTQKNIYDKELVIFHRF